MSNRRRSQPHLIKSTGLLSAGFAALFVGGAAAQVQAPGAPGLSEGWAPSNKLGFGTSVDVRANAWFTVGPSGLTEIYYPTLDTPSVRDMQLIVSDGKTFAEREADGTTGSTVALDNGALSYQQVERAKSGRYSITKTYSVDSTHATILVHVKFSALSGGPYQVYALLNPAPNNDLLHTTGETLGAALVASGSGAGTESGQVFKQRRDASDGMKNYPDEKGGKEVPLIATAFAADPPFIRTSNGFFGTSDGATDLYRHLSMNWTYAQASHGNVVQTGQTTLDGVNQTEATFAIGFGSTTGAALSAAEQSLASGFNSIDDAYVAGWRSHLARIKPAPSWLTDEERRLYNSSALVLSASEDKTNPGAFVASPSMPWVNEFIFPVGPYHLVWARDLYQIATALISIGDLDGAERALTFLFDRQQKTDGSFPQNSTVDGKPFFESLQLDEVGLIGN